MNKVLDTASARLRRVDEIQQIVQIVQDIIGTDKIFLLPEQLYQLLNPTPHYLAKYHFLLVSREREPITASRIEEIIEYQLSEKSIASIFMIDSHLFHFRYSHQQYFFPQLEKSTIIYDRTHRPLPCRPRPNIPAIQKFLRTSFHLHFTKAEQLIQMAREAWVKGIMNLEILGECTRCIFQAIEVVFTGFNSDSHHLVWLRKYTARFSPELPGIFPCHTEKEKLLLYRLHQASARKPLKAKIPFTEPLYRAALARVEDMLMVGNLVCSAHINGLCWP